MLTVSDSTPLPRQANTFTPPVEDDIWFDALDYVEIKESWFDACDTLPAEAAAESVVPFTEDCRRCVKQLIGTLGEFKQNELLAAGLAKLLPGVPAAILFAADSLYTAIVERRNIDSAMLHALGLACWSLPDDLNMIARLAAYIRETLISYTGASFLQQFLGSDENGTASHLFTALAIAAIAGKHWLTSEKAPQRAFLRIPAFMANLMVRANHYWRALTNMASAAPASQPISPHQPAFEIDTSIETLAAPSAQPVITAFSANSTALPAYATKATVANRPTIAMQSSASVAEKAHALAAGRLQQHSGLSELMYCNTRKTQTAQRQQDGMLTHTHFHTQCDAVEQAAPLAEQAALSSAHARDALLPMVATAAAATTAHSYLHTLKSKGVVAGSATLGAASLVFGGKMLWDKLHSGSEEVAPPVANAAKAVPGVPKEKNSRIQALNIKGTNRNIFKHYKLVSDLSGKVEPAKPRQMLDTGMLSYGSAVYQSTGFMTFTLPKQKDPVQARMVGVTNILKKGNNKFDFSIRVNTTRSKTTFFTLNERNDKPVFSLAKDGFDLVINHDGFITTIKNAYTSLADVSKFSIDINKGRFSYITVKFNGKEIFSDLLEQGTRHLFLGIDCEKPSPYIRSVDIKDVTKTHTAENDLTIDWANFSSLMKKTGIEFDNDVNPFIKDSAKFYGSKDNLKIRQIRKELLSTLKNKGVNKRAIASEATLTTVLNAVSLNYLMNVLADPNSSREQKEAAIGDYLKTTAADIFSFSAGLIEHMDPYKLVSGEYSTGIKGLLKTGGASVGIIFNAMNFIEGLEEEDILKVMSATIGIAGSIAGVVLSGLSGFGIGLFILAIKFTLDTMDDYGKRGEEREKFFHDTIMNATRNQLYDFTWMAKSNQEGESASGDNPFLLSGINQPEAKEKNDGGNDNLYYLTLQGHQEITPEQAGSINGIVYDTSPDNEIKGFKGFHTKASSGNSKLAHLIYTSSHMVKDTSLNAHANQGKDIITANNNLLEGDDTIVSSSIDAKIETGGGNDIIFVSGQEAVVDGGTGSNIAIIDGQGQKLTLEVRGDNSALLNQRTELLNINSYIISGSGHKVIINCAGIENTIPVFICQQGSTLILKNPTGNGQTAIVKEYGSKARVKENSHYNFLSVPNRVSMGDKTIAMQKGFAVKEVYD